MVIPEVQVFPNTWVGWAWLGVGGGIGSPRTSPTPLPLSYTDIDLWPRNSIWAADSMAPREIAMVKKTVHTPFTPSPH